MPLLEFKLNIFTEIHDWSKKPYSAEMSLKGWFAFIGMLLVVTIMWHQIIRFIID